LWRWLSEEAMLFGAEFKAERNREKKLESGVGGAERRLRLDKRRAPSRRLPTTAVQANGGFRQ
jgi:membrane protein